MASSDSDFSTQEARFAGSPGALMRRVRNEGLSAN
jgi:hypothetical protein